MATRLHRQGILTPPQTIIRHGDHFAWRMNHPYGRNTQSEEPDSPEPKLRPPEPMPPTHWVDLRHQLHYPDDKGQIEPAAGTPYRLTLPDGKVETGKLDSNGFASFSGIKPGICTAEYDPDIDPEIEALQKDIQQVLDSIIDAEQAEYVAIKKELEDARVFGLDFPGSNDMARVEMFKQALATGIWNGVKGIAGFAWDLLKGAGWAMYQASVQINPLMTPIKFRQELARLKASYQALQQFADADLELFAALIGDDDTQEMFLQFAKDYIKAQHSLEITETGGEVVFDVVLTVITAGFGAAGSVRHTAKLQKLKPLLEKLMALLKRKRAKGKNSGQHDHELKSTVPLRNPHKGLHNRGDLTPDPKKDSFKPTRQVDMDNLSEADEVTEKALLAQGRSGKDIKQLLSSGDNFHTKTLEKGDKLYGFGSASHGSKAKDSMYWLDESGYQDVKKEYFKQGHWDKEGVKNHLSLPCYNRGDAIDVATVDKSHNALESTVGKATEQLAYTKDNYTTGMLGKIMPGGGRQITPDENALSSVINRLTGNP